MFVCVVGGGQWMWWQQQGLPMGVEKWRGRLVLPLLAWFTWMKIIQVNLAEILAQKYLANCNQGLMMVISEANGLETCWAEISLK